MSPVKRTLSVGGGALFLCCVLPFLLIGTACFFAAGFVVEIVLVAVGAGLAGIVYLRQRRRGCCGEEG